MQTNIHTIAIPEGWHAEIDKEDNVIRIVENKKESQGARTWKEYCDKVGLCSIHGIDNSYTHYPKQGIVFFVRSIMGTEYFNSKEECAATDALRQLLLLHKDWVGDWKPDYKNTLITKYCIECDENEIRVWGHCTQSRWLSFPTEDMAKDFLECFRYLIEKAKILL